MTDVRELEGTKLLSVPGDVESSWEADSGVERSSVRDGSNKGSSEGWVFVASESKLAAKEEQRELPELVGFRIMTVEMSRAAASTIFWTIGRARTGSNNLNFQGCQDSFRE